MDCKDYSRDLGVPGGKPRSEAGGEIRRRIIQKSFRRQNLPDRNHPSLLQDSGVQSEELFSEEYEQWSEETEESSW